MTRTFPNWPSVLHLFLAATIFSGSIMSAAAFQLTICQNEDFVKCTSYARLESSGTCTPVPWNDDVSCFEVSCGCCEFFSDSGCRGRLFTACNEKKSALSGGDGEKISSFRCYY